MANIIKLAIVEDEPLLRELLATSLSAEPSIEIVGCFGDAAEAMANIPSLGANMVTLDVELGKGPTGIDVGLALRQALPYIAIILLSNHRPTRLFDAIPTDERDRWSYLLKGSLRDIKTLVEMIETVYRGDVVRDPSLASTNKGATEPFKVLTRRQVEVLALLAEGYSNMAIARQLLLTEKTVENHLTHIYQQLGIPAKNPDEHSRVLALKRYLHEVQPVGSAI